MVDESASMMTGAAFELANAGFKPMPDMEQQDEKDSIDSDSASLREAAERRSRPSGETVIREYLDHQDQPVSPDEAITLDRAVRDYSSATSADKLLAEGVTSKEFVARVDQLRAEAWADDPDVARVQGFEPPSEKIDKAKSGKSSSEDAGGEPEQSSTDLPVDGLDPEIEKAINHPQVRQAIEQRIGETEKTRQDYLNGLAAATQIAQVSFLGQFPELGGIAPENLPSALEQMSRQDPARFARVQAMITTTQQMFAQQQQESRHQAERARQSFLSLAKSEDARLDTMLKGESRAMQQAVSTEIIASAKESGVEPAELFRLYNSEPLMRNAVFQRMMYDAGKYRLMMKARDVAAAKPVPPVQRPGMARTPAERNHADVRTLSARLSNSGDIKDAVALYNARKSSKR